MLRGGEFCVCELTAILELSQPTVSRHLAYLRAHGLVADRRAGQWIHYRLPRELPAWVRQVLRAAVADAGDDSPLAHDAHQLAQLDRGRIDRARLNGTRNGARLTKTQLNRARAARCW